MLRKLTRILPDAWLVFLYKTIPTSKKMKDLVMWYTNRRFLVAVLGIITNEKGEVLLLHHTYRNQPLGIPSGWMEYEQPCRAIERELFEEIGLQININETLQTTFYENPNRVDILLRGSFEGGTFKKSAEVTDYGFYSPTSLPEGVPDVQKALIENNLPQNKRTTSIR